MSIATPHDATIGGRVRDLREKRRMTQAELASRIGVTFQQVQKYEKGTNRMAATRLLRIAQALDVSAASLIGAAASDDGLAAMLETPSGRELADCWAALPIDTRDALLRIARAASGRDQTVQ
jgi:transcriptional regulator with XRE-family HTH domain